MTCKGDETNRSLLDDVADVTHLIQPPRRVQGSSSSVFLGRSRLSIKWAPKSIAKSGFNKSMRQRKVENKQWKREIGKKCGRCEFFIVLNKRGTSYSFLSCNLFLPRAMNSPPVTRAVSGSLSVQTQSFGVARL